jgi:hypothetical protein
MGPPERAPVVQAVKDLIELATARPVGIGYAPVDPNGEQAKFPFVVLFPRSRARFRGPIFQDSWSDADFEISVRSVGLKSEQAETLADRIRAAILSKDEEGQWIFNLDVGPNQRVMDRRPDVYSPGDLRPEGKIFEVDDSFVFSITTS